ncbi:hypothetical protein TanjilG_21789 [Lupinus angustifolius]|nr:hypothetical protein TanjilG_21789 [Lupinus angustifolius]
MTRMVVALKSLIQDSRTRGGDDTHGGGAFMAPTVGYCLDVVYQREAASSVAPVARKVNSG